MFSSFSMKSKALMTSGLTLTSLLMRQDSSTCSIPSTSNKETVKRNAICVLQQVEKSKSHGLVSFSQDNYSSSTKMIANIFGTRPNTDHSLILHTNGDLTGNGNCIGDAFNFSGKHLYA